MGYVSMCGAPHVHTSLLLPWVLPLRAVLSSMGCHISTLKHSTRKMHVYLDASLTHVLPRCGCCWMFTVSEGMRSLGTAMYLLTMAVGTYLASALNIIVAAASPKDLWVSDNPLFGHYDW